MKQGTKLHSFHVDNGWSPEWKTPSTDDFNQANLSNRVHKERQAHKYLIVATTWIHEIGWQISIPSYFAEDVMTAGNLSKDLAIDSS